MCSETQVNKHQVKLTQRSSVPIGRKLHNLAWGMVNKCVFPVTFRLNMLRRILLRLFGAKIGRGVRISPRCIIEYPDRLSIGNNSSIGNRCLVQCLDNITIGSNVCISDEVALLTGSHDLQSGTFELYTRPIVLSDGVWIAYRATVLSGVQLGAGVVVGASSLIAKSYEKNKILSGNPAEVIRNRYI